MSNTTLASKPRWTQAFQRLWTMHWVMAACFLIIYLVGMVMARLPREVVFRGSLYNLHKSFGMLVLGLLLIRIFMLLQVFSRKYLKRSPRLTSQWSKVFGLHVLLYCLMLVVPISGIWLSNSGGHDLPFFGFTLPNWFAENRAVGKLAEDLHFWLSYTLLACVGLHLAQQRRFVQKIWRRVTSQ